MQDYLVDKKAVVTGVSKGIGKALALQLLSRGVAVFGLGRTAPDYEHKLLHFFQADIRDEAEVDAAAQLIERQHGAVDFLINNAGFGYFSAIENFDTAKWQAMIDVNLTGMMFVTRAFVRGMQSRGSGHIVNISSVAGRVGAPWGEGYNATKFAVRGFSESLFHELRKSGIKVSTVYPGSVKTNFFDEIAGVDAHENMMAPEEVAGTILHMLDSHPNYLIREIEMRPLNSKKPG